MVAPLAETLDETMRDAAIAESMKKVEGDDGVFGATGGDDTGCASGGAPGQVTGGTATCSEIDKLTDDPYDDF